MTPCCKAMCFKSKLQLLVIIKCIFFVFMLYIIMNANVARIKALNQLVILNDLIWNYKNSNFK
jgi:hypothetical protein